MSDSKTTLSIDGNQRLADLTAALQKIADSDWRGGAWCMAIAREALRLGEIARVDLGASKPAISRITGPALCPAGHGPMHYTIADDRLHCHCGAVATTHGNIIVDPDPVIDMEPKRGA